MTPEHQKIVDELDASHAGIICQPPDYPSTAIAQNRVFMKCAYKFWPTLSAALRSASSKTFAPGENDPKQREAKMTTANDASVMTVEPNVESLDGTISRAMMEWAKYANYPPLDGTDRITGRKMAQELKSQVLTAFSTLQAERDKLREIVEKTGDFMNAVVADSEQALAQYMDGHAMQSFLEQMVIGSKRERDTFVALAAAT